MKNQYNEVLDNIAIIKKSITKTCQECGRDEKEVTIMAVTKTVDTEKVNFAIDNGIAFLGENRVQEFLSKKDEYKLGKNNVHFIGHLQTNKVKSIVEDVSMIQSVSSVKLAKEISRCCSEKDIQMDILLQVNIGKEESKSGFLVDELMESLQIISKIDNISVKGLMCIPPKEDSEKFFSDMHKLFVDIRGKNMDNISMEFLSMGMSNDYCLAIKHGANIVRIGSALFGKRY